MFQGLELWALGRRSWQEEEPLAEKWLETTRSWEPWDGVGWGGGIVSSEVTVRCSPNLQSAQKLLWLLSSLLVLNN